ncbi:PH domain-containing protein [Aliikangiella sp. IMCC44359]|uniref:PH domain-containing protein n=1 Tax=Aliikangiella sp. IMCC44359 TaxID=3459125 RepID=UPI00403A9DC9
MNSAQAVWHRLSPISICFFLIRLVKGLLKAATPGLIPLFAIMLNTDDKSRMLILIFGGILAISALVSLLQYWFFLYRIKDGKILINEGVLKKNQRSIPFSKIQNINILQPIYFKLFKLVTLQLETAGSSQSEVNLPGIKQKDAEELKLKILENIHSNSAINENNVVSDSIIAQANLKKLIQYGITSNNIFWFLVVIAPVVGMLENVIEKVIGKQNIIDAIEYLGGGFSGGIMLISLSLILLIALMFLFSILGAVLKHFNYQLKQNENTLVRKGGLLTTHEESAKLTKIQAIIKQTNFLGHFYQTENMILKQATIQTQNKSSGNHLFVIPARTKEQAKKLCSIVFNQFTQPTEVHKINKRYISKTLFTWMLLPTLFISYLAIQTQSLHPLLALSGGIFLYPVIWKKWGKFRYGINEKFGFYQRGFIGYRKIYFPTFKVQRIKISQSPLQRKRKLATLIIYLASERITIPYMSLDHAEEWFDRISFNIENTHQNWY